MLVAAVVFAGLIHLPVIGLGAIGSPDPRAQLLLLLPSVVGAVRELLARRLQPLLATPVLCLLAWPSWISISSLLGPEPIDGFVRGAWFGATAITLVGAVDRNGLVATLTAGAAATTAFVGLGIGLHATGLVDGAWQIELANEPLFPWTRLNALGPNQTVLGLTGTLTALSLFVIHRRIGLLGSCVVGVIGVAGVAARHNRSAIAALVAGGVAAAVWARRRWSLWALAGLLGLGSAAVFVGQVSRRLNRDALADDELFDFYEGSERGVLTGRTEVWRDAWELGLRQPLTGGGNGSFARFADEEFVSGSSRWDPNHAHNVALEVFADQGLVGVLLMVATMIAVGRTWRRWSPGVAAIFTAVCVHSVVEAMFYGAPSTRWTFLVIAVASLTSGGGEKSPRPERRSDQQAQRVDQQRPLQPAGPG